MTTIVEPLATRTTAPPGLRPLALVALLSGIFLAMADFFVVNVALVDMGRELSASTSALELIVAGYAITYALLLVIGGRLGDAFGRRRMFLLGMVAFTITSAMCGFAPTAITLVVGRIAQGASAALMIPQVLATVQATTTGRERARALSAFAATGVILAAIYILTMFQKMFMGETRNEENKHLLDLSERELWVVVPIIVFIFIIGLYPNPFFQVMTTSVNGVLRQVGALVAGG